MKTLRRWPPITGTSSAIYPPRWVSGQPSAGPDRYCEPKPFEIKPYDIGACDSKPFRILLQPSVFGRFCQLLLLCIVFLAGCSKPIAPTDPPPINSLAPVSAERPDANHTSEYLGSEACASCHAQAYENWRGSHHAMAMAVPNQETVRADFSAAPLEIAGVPIAFVEDDQGFSVTLDGGDGALADFRVAYTFGVSPLQQYLTEVGNGRLQALPVVWDTRTNGQGWYHLQPDTVGKPQDVLHWAATGQNWNHMCADCHSTQVRKRFDPQTQGFDTTFAEISVGCEGCHGPGLAHSQDPSRGGMVSLRNPQVRLEVCASCHSRRTQIAEGFAPGRSYLDHFSPALLDDGLYFADGQILDEVFVYGSFLQSKMHGAGVTCGDCHDPHTGQLQRNGNDVCTACHSPEGSQRFPGLQAKVYNSVDHHFHPVANERRQNPRDKPGAGNGSACVDCHMASRTYMGVDDRRDHSFRIPRPDLSAQIDVPNACIGCHQDQDDAWAAQQIRDHGGSLGQRHFAHVIAPARQGKGDADGPLQTLAADPDQPAIVRATALSLAGQYQPRLSLYAGLTSPVPLVRLGALRGLSSPNVQDWPRVLPLLEDPLRAIRFAAITALLPAYAQLSVPERAQLDGALEEYMTYLGSNQDRAEALTNRSLVHQARGNYSAAEQDLKLALKRNPSWVPGLVNLADLYRASGRDAQAGGLLQQAIALSPRTAQVRIATALWHVRQGNMGSALSLLAEGHRSGPEAGIGYVYAVALSSAGQADKAMDVVDELIEADIHSDQLVHLGMSLAQQQGAAERARGYRSLLGL